MRARRRDREQLRRVHVDLGRTVLGCETRVSHELELVRLLSPGYPEGVWTVLLESVRTPTEDRLVAFFPASIGSD